MPDLAGLEVAVFESKRAEEMATLVERFGGRPLSAPSIREVLLDPGPDAVELVRMLRAGALDAVLFLTRTGVEGLADVMGPILPRQELVELLRGVPAGGRGPKTVQALRDLGLEDIVSSGAPHTSTQLVADFDRRHPVAGTHVALVEHGFHHAIARSLLLDRGAEVLPVAVYRWALPLDVEPLDAAIEGLVSGSIRVALFTNGVQVDSVVGLASEQDLDEPLREALQNCVVGAIGPVCADRLRAFGIEPDVVPERTSMEELVRAVAERAEALLRGGDG
jgi:uroporphyrinogen-III synthase